MDIVIATNNAHKVEEYKEILKEFNVNCYTLKDLGIKSDPDETGTTFKENSIIKAMSVAKQTKMVVIADDSGLCIDALPDILGIYSSRFMGEDTSYEVKCNEVIRLLENKDRSAHFTCAITIANLKEEPVCFEGFVYGQIGYEYKGKGGFGYDPIFIPNGYDCTIAEVSAETKNKISHRANASKALVKFLKENI